MKKILLLVFFLSLDVYASDITLDTVIEMQHQSDFIVADKKAGKIYVFKDNEKYEAPALYGRLKSDIYDNEYGDKPGNASYVTPSGIFPVEKVFSSVMNETVLMFIPGQYVFLAVHRVYKKIPSQRRLERLKSPDPNYHRISNGCINVPDDFFNKYLENIPDGTLLYVLPETSAGVDRFLNDLKKYGGIK